MAGYRPFDRPPNRPTAVDEEIARLREENYQRLLAFVAQRDRDQKRMRRQEKMPRDWTPEEQLDDLYERLEPVHKRALAAREKFRDHLAMLTTPKGQRKLTEEGRADERAEAIATARRGLEDLKRARSDVQEMLAQRAALTGLGAVFRQAKFVTAPDGADPLQVAMLEQTMWRRCWDECMTAPPEEFAESIREWKRTKNYPALEVAGKVYVRRVRAGERDLLPASSALVEAQKVDMPRDVTQLGTRFNQLAVIDADLTAVIDEFTAGRQLNDLGAKTRRVDELKAQGLDASEIAQQVSAEEREKRQQRAARAEKGMDTLIAKLLTEDDADADALAKGIPIGRNDAVPAVPPSETDTTEGGTDGTQGV